MEHYITVRQTGKDRGKTNIIGMDQNTGQQMGGYVQERTVTGEEK